MNFLNKIKMKKKLLFSYLIIVIVPILTISYFLTNKLHDLSFSDTRQLSYTAMNQLRGNLVNKLAVYTGMIDTLAKDSTLMMYMNTIYDNDYDAIIEYKSKIAPLISRLSDNDRDVSIRIYSHNNTIGFSRVTNNSVDDLYKEKWFDKSSAEKGSILWAKDYYSTGSKSTNKIICYRAFRNNYNSNEMGWAIAVAFDEKQIFSLISEEGTGGKVVFLYDNSGDIITTTERDLLGGSIKNLRFQDNRDINDTKDGSIVEYNSKKYLFISNKIFNRSTFIEGWNIAYMVPADKILRSVRDIWVTSFLLCIACMFFSFCIIYVVSSSITGRISNLVNTIKSVWDGNFKVSVKCSGTDEIGILETDFNRMIKKIDTLIHEVYEAEIRNQKISNEKKEADIIALQGQINPHYLFNTLESIRMNLLINKDKRTADVIKIFGESFRICFETKKEVYMLKEELKLIKNYFNIQQYIYGEKIDYFIDIPEYTIDYLIPKLILQPLVENAIYHGLELKEGKGMVRVKVNECQEELNICVTDDGVGIDEEELEKLKNNIYNEHKQKTDNANTHLALRNVHSRLKLMYGERYGISISSVKNSGTSVLIKMPICK